MTAITARNVAALIKNTVPASSPPAQPHQWPDQPPGPGSGSPHRADRLLDAPRGDQSGWSTCQVGESRARPVPTAKIRASSTHGVTSPASARTHQRPRHKQHQALRHQQKPPTVDEIAGRSGDRANSTTAGWPRSGPARRTSLNS